MKQLTALFVFIYILIFPFNITATCGDIRVGAESVDEYMHLIVGKKVAIASNQTSVVGDMHLVDWLRTKGVNIVGIFAPEHGFRGVADAGEHVSNSIDKKTGIPVWSLYSGKSGKPNQKQMQKFDVLIFDMQDVGLRFYTYYITMARLMDACAEHGKQVIILDRPNPNGSYVDGPILDMKHKSGVGIIPIPVVHGMTLGELALMINGEGWLPSKKECLLTVVRCRNYTHQTLYKLPIPPSPNLPNMKSIYLYPSVCLFEGTCVSLGRGTDFPFQVYGHPNITNRAFSFTPTSRSGAKNPPLKGQLCYGEDLRSISDDDIISEGLNLDYIIRAYRNLNMGERFFTSFFEKLIGVDYVRPMIIEGKSAKDIRKMWNKDVEQFIKDRRAYLLYEE